MKKNFWLIFEWFYNTKTLVIIMIGVLCLVFRDTVFGFAEDLIAWYFPWNIFLVVGFITTLGIIRIWKTSATTRSKSVVLTKQAVLVKVSATKKARPAKKKVIIWLTIRKRKMMRQFRSLSFISIIPKKWLRTIVLITAIILVLTSAMIAIGIHGGSQEPPKVEQKTELGKELVQQSQNIPTSRKVLGILIIFIVLGIFASRVKGQWEDDKRLYEQKSLRGPVGVTVYVILGTYLVIAFLLPIIWELMWSDQIFFWSLTIGILILVSLKTMTGSDGKPLTYANKGSWVFGTLLVIGLFAQMSRNPHWRDADSDSGDVRQIAMKRETSSSAFTNIPVDVAKRVVCECESNCQQFETDKDGNPILDDKGNKVPLKNKGIPEKGIPPSGAFGKYQFLEVHRGPALKLGFDLNTEEGQEKYFEHVYGKDGFKPWDHDNQYGGGSACWGPKLAALGYSGNDQISGFTKVVVAPTDKWSEEVGNPQRIKVTWGRLDWSKGGSCEVMLNRDPNKTFPISAQTHIGPTVMQFKCTEEGAEVEVRGIPNT